jgi:hypothetical protein
MRAAATGRPERRGERGFALLDVTIALAIAGLFALLALAGLARSALRVHAAAVAFEALMARVEAAAMARAERGAGAPATSGLTLTARASATGTTVEVYQGRPQPGATLPLTREPAIPPLTLDVTLEGTPFSIFVGGAGSLSAQPGYDAASNAQALASEPPCPPDGTIEVVFRDAFRSETAEFACANGQRVPR